jgi:hypothetical protein
MTGKIIEKDLRKFVANNSPGIEFTCVIQKKWKDKESGELKEAPAYFAKCIAYGANNIISVEHAIGGKYLSVLSCYPNEESWLDTKTNSTKYKTKYKVDKIENVKFENGEWVVVDSTEEVTEAPF